MIIIPVKEGEAIERALKRFKRKFDKTGAMRQLRARKEFIKPSVKRRKQMINRLKDDAWRSEGIFFGTADL